MEVKRNEHADIRDLKNDVLTQLKNINVCHVEIVIHDTDFTIRVLLDFIPIDYFNELNRVVKLFSYNIDKFYFEAGYDLYCFHCIEVD